MKTMFKHTLSFILTAMMLFGICVFASAETNGTCGENVTWSFDENTGAFTVSGTGDIENYIDYTETPWYSVASSVKSITISNGITSIGNYAFAMFENAETVSIPESVTKIGDYAFYNCEKLQSFDIPENIMHIGDGSFYYSGYYNNESNWVDGELYIENCLLYAVEDKKGTYEIKPGTKLIASFAFLFTVEINELIIPESVEHICDNAFFQCVYLDKITVDKNNAYYLSDENSIVFNIEKTELVLYPAKNPQTSYEVPESVKKIGNGAFALAENLIEISLPSGLTHIGNWSFIYCHYLRSINIPAGVTYIGDGAFMGCVALEKFVIPYGITEIGEYTFAFCYGLKSITIPDTITSIGVQAMVFEETFGDVYYSGSEDEWNAIFVDKYNVSLDNATIHYNTVVVDYFFNENTQIIETPLSTTINYGETITLNCGLTNLPEGYRVVWGLEGNAVKINPTFEGLTCEVTSVGDGEVVIKAGVIDENGNPVRDNNGNYIVASQKLVSKMNVFDVIVDFFTRIFDFLFGLFR